jgi:glycine betaine catabolism A
MYPVVADRTVVDCDWLYSPEVVARGTDLSHSVELFHRVNQQDFDACERCQSNLSSRLYAHGRVLVPNEHHIGAFHEWVTEKARRHHGAGMEARSFGTRRRGRRSRSW